MRCGKCGNMKRQYYKCVFCSLDDNIKGNLELRKYKD